jgi:peptidoglycan/xylan/chitin deacetylase (PgdA/CDA1 family)
LRYTKDENTMPAYDELAALVGCDFDAFLQKQKPYLTTEQVKTLIQQGFQFGAHSIDHPQYQFLPLAEQLRQTQVSMDFVQQKFDLSYRIFAFPFTDFGVSQAFFDALKANNIVDFSFGCAGQKYERFDGHAHRIPFEKGDWSAQNIYYREYFYYLAKALIGKNVIKR